MLVSQGVDAALAGVFGLLIGSFLNVVIYRLPKMLEQQWAAECANLGGAESAPPQDHGERFNLMVPRSRCQKCGHVIHWYENVPVLSYLLLRGKCSACKTPISLRYPIVELVTGLLFAWCVWRMPGQFGGLAWCGFAAALLALALIDWDTTLLPDDITLPLLWAGLLASLAGFTAVPLDSAVLGAVAGYGSLWAVYWLFKLTTGKEGMGYGDFKLFAAFGAWFGWQALVPIILMASVIGVDGGLDRARMRAIVFADAAAKKKLEAILHPLIGLECERQAAEAAASQPIVFDVPLLVESMRWRALVDRVIVVDATEATQLRRVVARSAWTPDAVRAVIAHQAPRALRRGAADAVIFNELLSLGELSEEVNALWKRWVGQGTR